jgi:proteasome accessory factor B
MNYTTRVHRLLRIIALIQSEQGWTPKRLAEELEISERNVYRDLDQLKAAGVPLFYDKETLQYRIIGSYFMPPVHLDVEEALALSALCEHITDRDQIPFLRPAWRALSKIEAQLPYETKQELADRRRTMAIKTTQTMPPDGFQDVYDTVQEALSAGRVLVCKYDAVTSDRDGGSSGGTDAEFDLEPYALFFAVRAWYVVGQRSDRDDLRTLKLNRFTKIELTDRPYAVPDDFTLEKYVGNAWSMFGSGEDVEVEILFDKEFAETMADTRWHKTQQVEWHRDGSCTFKCTVAGLDEIVWWVLSMGPHCEVVRPGALRERVHSLCEATASVYDAPE